MTSCSSRKGNRPDRLLIVVLLKQLANNHFTPIAHILHSFYYIVIADFMTERVWAKGVRFPACLD